MIYETIQDFPADIGQTDVTIRSVNVVGQQVNPFTLARETQVFPGAGWELEISILPAERAEAQRLEAFLLSLRGRAGKFRLADPYRSLPLGSNLGNPHVLSATAGEESFTSNGWEPEESALLKAGDFIELTGRLHMVLLDVSSDAAGQATIAVWPPLRSSHSEGSVIVTENARGVFQLAVNTSEFTRNVSGYNGAMLRAVEVPTQVPVPEVLTLGGEDLTLAAEDLTITPEP